MITHYDPVLRVQITFALIFLIPISRLSSLTIIYVNPDTEPILWYNSIIIYIVTLKKNANSIRIFEI